MMKLLAIAVLGAALLSGGCATVTRGSTTDFVVESEPAGAKVTADNGLKCDATPCAFPKVKRKSEFSVTVEKDGYLPSTHAITNKMSSGGANGMAGNILIGGLIGVAVDASSGATQDLTPNPLRVTLTPVPQAPVAAPSPEQSAPEAPTTESVPAEPAPEAAAPTS